MIEREPDAPSSRFEVEYETWDPETVATCLYSQAEVIQDELLGDGYHIQLGPKRQLDLSLYPAENIVRISSQNCSIELHQQVSPRLGDGCLLLTPKPDEGVERNERCQITLLTAQGNLILNITSARNQNEAHVGCVGDVRHVGYRTCGAHHQPMRHLLTHCD